MLATALPFVLPLKGGSNFRDLGGYRTGDGRLVRRGVVVPAHFVRLVGAHGLPAR